MAGEPGGRRFTLNPRVLEMLVCPLTKTRLTLSEGRDELISVAARLAFPITKGVPLLSLEEARPLEGEELERLSRNLT
ncbi:Trm112 family protein [Devosia chinhatensis]|uniref:Uncharacterized protein n=1 Tax=Devosia chinhatensis TaxID=429727 RepID=A0A0F5FGD2_9HYPH|nr:Trm112 family protein [Devosia chinhatensis]KKB07964.1 hypothetical protein VE26_15280 [Devosia chinhatensis]